MLSLLLYISCTILRSNVNIGSSTVPVNISLEGSTYFYFDAYHIDIYDCSDIKVHWEIQRVDGETEVYTVVNETSYYVQLPDRGVDFITICCETYFIIISPTDLRYNGAMITGIVNLPECFDSSNVTDPFTLNIQDTVGNT